MLAVRLAGRLYFFRYPELSFVKQWRVRAQNPVKAGEATEFDNESPSFRPFIQDFPLLLERVHAVRLGTEV